MYTNRVAHGDGLTVLRRKGRELAMMASSGFKKFCDYCNKSDHKNPIVSNFCVSLAGDHPLRAARKEKFGAVCITRTFTTTITTSPNNQQRRNGGGSDYAHSNNNSGNSNKRRHGGGSNRGNAAATANGTFSTTVTTSAPAELLSRLFQLRFCLPRLLPRLLRTASLCHLHRA